MQRRDFFKCIMPRSLKTIQACIADPTPSDNEVFLEAMRLGIDPATLSPDALRQCIERRQKDATEKHQPSALPSKTPPG